MQLRTKLGALEATGQSVLFETIDCYSPYDRILLHSPDIDQAAIQTIKALRAASCDPSCADKDESSIHARLSWLLRPIIWSRWSQKNVKFKKYINTRDGKSGRTLIYQGELQMEKIKVVDRATAQTRTVKLLNKQFCTSWKTTRCYASRLRNLAPEGT